MNERSPSDVQSPVSHVAPLLRCAGLGRSVRGTTILDSVDLDVASGEFVVITGPSGAGKTSLLRLVAGLDCPTAGRIEIAGQPVSTPRRVLAPSRRGVGMVFEQPALWPHLTVERHMTLVLKASRFGADERRERMERLLERLQLARLRDRFPHELSGGERRRVALARSLALSPQILLLDEPLAHLDVHLAADLAGLLIDVHRQESLTTLCVMHRPEEVNDAVNRYVILEGGRVVQAGCGIDVFGAPKTPFVAALARVLSRSRS